MGNLPDPRQDLAHVLWMGGSPCSGKSSIAEMLAHRHELQIYHVDEAFSERHRKRLVPAQHPTLYKWHTTPWDELWMQPQERLLAEAIAAYGEHFGMILEDLLSMPRSTTVLAEGTALLPDPVSSLQPDRRRALWIVPSEEFQRNHYPNRGHWVQAVLSQCEDPGQALQNWMDRDVAFARWATDRAKELGMALLQVDGTRSIVENAAWVTRHFRLE
jgi:2-phosphoglycerate kinase